MNGCGRLSIMVFERTRVMRIGIVGLGLIGGSLAKAIKKNTAHSCYALDIDRAALAGAMAQEAIDGEITAQELSSCDVVIVCPQRNVPESGCSSSISILKSMVWK